MTEFPVLTVTTVVEHDGKFLLIKRAQHEKHYAGYWAFPGGRPHIGETVIDAIKREVLEETGLEVSGEGAFLNSYFFKNVIGIAFLVRVINKNVLLSDEATEYTWVSSVEDILQRDCIEGICNHLANALEVIKKGKLVNLEDSHLIQDKYLNS